MKDLTPQTAGQPIVPVSPAKGARVPQQKAIDLAILKKGTKDFLEFVDATKEVCFGYLYHRTGSLKLTQTLMKEIYLSVLSHSMSLWWFGALSVKFLLETADHVLRDRPLEEADLDRVYLPRLAWLTDNERKVVSSLHDALWTLPIPAQRLLILSILLGFPDERIGQFLLERPDMVSEGLKTAKDILLSRWQPSAEIREKLGSLVFVPALDIHQETDLRFSVVEKYNSIRFRRYQWVIIGGIFAVLSNVIVASVLAFAVVTQPPTSLKGSRTEVASLDALLVKREMELAATKRSIAASFKEAQRITAYDVTRNLTTIGLGSALQALKAEQTDEAQVERMIKLLERARTALKPYIDGTLYAVRAILATGG